ncbi:FtsW/RodA/SpoVE family cell cycle protein [Candidatus Dojkabacteria bacterium]|nr:FtsW/RodA/SpoVE family cell cycle protein [Candidatus Dojkabacteria bacterium]
MFSLKILKNHDYIITICVILLTILSLVLIYSTTLNAVTLEGGAGTFKKQILFFIAGYFIYFILSTFDISWLQNFRVLLLLYIITIFFLIYVKFFTPEVANTNRWINILGFGFQPAEYAKITLTIITAVIFSSSKEEYEKIIDIGVRKKKKIRKKGLKVSILQFIFKLHYKIDEKFPNFYKYALSFMLLLPIFILVFMQPSFGNSIIILFIWAAIIFTTSSSQLAIINLLIPFFLIPLFQWKIVSFGGIFSGIDTEINILDISLIALIIIIIAAIALALKSKIKWYLIIFSILLAFTIKPTITAIWESNLLNGYQKERIETFFNDPEEDPLDSGYQVRQSKIAIGAGRLLGRGYLQGTQSTLKVLPYAHTDFIFASLAEQFGLIGSTILILIYLTLLVRIQSAAMQTKDEFAFLLYTGFCMILLLNIFINIGMNLGKLPVTGVPLPLVSYGGSSVIVNMTALGLIQAARKRISLKDISESFTPNSHPWQ